MSFISPFLIITLLLASAYILGIFIFMTDYEENKCEMTYMFEYPQYVVGTPILEVRIT